MNITFDHETGEYCATDPDYPQLPPGYGSSEQAAAVAALEGVTQYLDHLRHGNAVEELTRLWEAAWKV